MIELTVDGSTIEDEVMAGGKFPRQYDNQITALLSGLCA